MIDYRSKELMDALDHYSCEMEAISSRKVELMRQEHEAWRTLQLVIHADDPKKLSPYFRVNEPIEDDK